MNSGDSSYKAQDGIIVFLVADQCRFSIYAGCSYARLTNLENSNKVMSILGKIPSSYRLQKSPM